MSKTKFILGSMCIITDSGHMFFDELFFIEKIDGDLYHLNSTEHGRTIVNKSHVKSIIKPSSELDELKQALKLISKYNKMDFNDFADLLQRETGKKITKDQRDKFSFTGLNNIDFLKLNPI